MKQIKLLLVAFVLLSAVVPAGAQKPELRTVNGIKRLFYHGEPFLMLSGELHNSTASTDTYLVPAMASVKSMNLNSLIVTAEWDLIEPVKGQYDFSTIDCIIENAEKNDLPVVICWFGTWKNGVSSYIPGWMKRDTKTYFRAVTESGEATDYISAFCSAARDADARAFAAVMRHIRERDTKNYVLFMQVENETGLWQQSIDCCKQAQKLYSKPVPRELLRFLRENESILDTPMKNYWVENGRKDSGDWKTVFGDNLYTEAFFMQWAYASYIEEVAAAGKAEYDIPMYLNTVAMPVKGPQFNPGAVQSSNEKQKAQGAPPPPASFFGSQSPLFPSGGPVYQAIDLYKLFCPSIDFCSPDIYVQDFKNVSDAYTRPDNPLFVPETGRNASPAYYALAQNNAIGFSAFAIEDAYLSRDYIGTYETLSELLPIISKYQGTGAMRGFLREDAEEGTEFNLGDYTFTVKYITQESRSFGLVIQTGPEEFILSGLGAIITAKNKNDDLITRYEYIQEGRFEDGVWINEVWLNGDQTGHGQELYLRGRVSYADEFTPGPDEVYPRHNVASSEARQALVTGRQKSPSIYKTKLYNYMK